MMFFEIIMTWEAVLIALALGVVFAFYLRNKTHEALAKSKCPRCRELVSRQAVICPHCSHKLRS